MLSVKVTPEGREPMPKKLDVMKLMKFPIDNIAMASFLGSFVYYRMHMPMYSTYAAVLYGMKEDDFKSPNELQREAFHQLKEEFMQLHILGHPDIEREFEVMVYSNRHSIGGVITQLRDGKYVPIGYASRILKASEKGYEHVEKEILAILAVTKRFKHILDSGRFTVWTASDNIKWYMNADRVGGRPERFRVECSIFDMTIKKVDRKLLTLPAMLASSMVTPEQYAQSMEEFIPSDTILSRMPLRAIPPKKLNTKYALSWDGASSGQKSESPGSCASIIWDASTWKVIWQKGKMLGKNVTVNQAEYAGYLMALNQAQEMGLKEITAFGDSRLVVEQVNGNNCVKEPTLKILNGKIMDIINSMDLVETYHMPRAFNASADFLANEAKSSIEPIEVNAEKLMEINQIPRYVDLVSGKEGSNSSDTEDMLKKSILQTDEELKESADELIAKVMMTGSIPNTVDKDKALLERNVARIRMVNMDGVGSDEEIKSKVMQAASQILNVHQDRINQDDNQGTRWEGESSEESATFLDVDEERRDRISKAQDSDPKLKIIKQFLRSDPLDMPPKAWIKKHKDRMQKFVLYQGKLLIHLWTDKLGLKQETYMQVCIPEVMISYILTSYHSEEFGGHLGLAKTYVRLRKSFFWNGMWRDLEHHIKSCYICQTCLNHGGGTSASPGNVHAKRPGHILAMDIVSKLPKGTTGATHAIVFVCIFTGFCWAFPLNSTTAAACADALHKVFCQIGPCGIIRHDRDKRFLGAIFDVIRKRWNIHQLATLAYNPTGDGHVERKIQTVQMLLRKLTTSPLQSDWDQNLERVCFSLNSSYDAERKETPFYIMHGWDPKSTMELAIGAPNGIEDIKCKRWRKTVNERSRIVKELVEKQYRSVQLKRAVQSEKFQRGKPFEIGDRVWSFDPKYGQDENRKFSSRWIGPWRIIEKKSDRPFMYKINSEDHGNKQHPWIKYDRLKKCYDPDYRPFLKPVSELTLTMLDQDLEGFRNAIDEDYEREVTQIVDARITRLEKHSQPLYEFLAIMQDGSKLWYEYDDLNCDFLVKEYLAKNKYPTLMYVTNATRKMEAEMRAKSMEDHNQLPTTLSRMEPPMIDQWAANPMEPQESKENYTREEHDENNTVELESTQSQGDDSDEDNEDENGISSINDAHDEEIEVLCPEMVDSVGDLSMKQLNKESMPRDKGSRRRRPKEWISMLVRSTRMNIVRRLRRRK